MVLIIGILIIIVETNKKVCKEKTGKGPRFIKQNIKENVEGTEQSRGPCMELEEPHQNPKENSNLVLCSNSNTNLYCLWRRAGGREAINNWRHIQEEGSSHSGVVGGMVEGLYQILEDSGVQGRRIATTEHGYIQIATH